VSETCRAGKPGVCRGTRTLPWPRTRNPTQLRVRMRTTHSAERRDHRRHFSQFCPPLKVRTFPAPVLLARGGCTSRFLEAAGSWPRAQEFVSGTRGRRRVGTRLGQIRSPFPFILGLLAPLVSSPAAPQVLGPFRASEGASTPALHSVLSAGRHLTILNLGSNV
jgi:hypothetical protein